MNTTTPATMQAPADNAAPVMSGANRGNCAGARRELETELRSPRKKSGRERRSNRRLRADIALLKGAPGADVWGDGLLTRGDCQRLRQAVRNGWGVRPRVLLRLFKQALLTATSRQASDRLSVAACATVIGTCEAAEAAVVAMLRELAPRVRSELSPREVARLDNLIGPSDQQSDRFP